ncbi:MAG: hypothetical protein EPO62_02485 [Candidatus Nitrosotenuis sp.]|nr:MAG: hypothetical protein EPO62_02485 [Candidatus Nitrosotenuis sp.]
MTIQQGVNNLADIVVLLEVLGYNNELVTKNGFQSLPDLAKYVYDFIDLYYNAEQDKKSMELLATPIPTPTQRLAEGLGMIFPWLGSLVLLFLTGVSLWMALSLPKELTTAFVGGVFLGLLITEGSMQIFQKLFTFYYNQTNIGEVKRILKRSYLTVSVLLLVASLGLLVAAKLADLPYQLVGVAIISMVTVSLHRASYMIIYSLKKIKHLIVGYASAFVSIGTVYFLAEGAIPDNTVRYFASLGVAFSVLTVFAVFHHRKILEKKSVSIIAGNVPHFYNPVSTSDKTLRSRFHVQIWEMLPHSVFGTLYFSTLFTDRLLSWIYHPDIVSGTSDRLFEFNSMYHTGADLALLVILSASMLQYVLMSPIYIRLNNMIIDLKISESDKIDRFLQKQYAQLVILSLVLSATTATVLFVFAPQIAVHLGGTEKTVMVLRLASIGNVFISMHAANLMFIAFLNKIKPLVYMSIVAVSIIAVGGAILGKSGYENITIAYLASAVFSFTVSTVCVRKIIRNASSTYFAKYV